MKRREGGGAGEEERRRGEERGAPSLQNEDSNTTGDWEQLQVDCLRTFQAKPFVLQHPYDFPNHPAVLGHLFEETAPRVLLLLPSSSSSSSFCLCSPARGAWASDRP